MTRLLAHFAALLALALALAPAGPALAQPVGEMPRAIRQLEQQYRAGDWLLQCDSWRACRIVGVAPASQDLNRERPVIMIRRGWKRGDPFELRIGLVNGLGEVTVPPIGSKARLEARRWVRRPLGLDFAIGEAAADRSLALTGMEPARLVRALRRWPDSRLVLGPGRSLVMPRGNLDYLLRKMDQLQFPSTDPLSPANKDKWLREYHYRVVPLKPATGGTPQDVSLACDTRTYPTGGEAWQLGPDRVLWISQCPEGSKLFMQVGKGDPQQFDLKDRAGRIQPVIWVSYDKDRKLLRVAVPREKRGDCGDFARFGWTDNSTFGMIEHRRMTLCRGVPAEWWPLTWTPSSWKFVTPPRLRGMRPPRSGG